MSFIERLKKQPAGAPQTAGEPLVHTMPAEAQEAATSTAPPPEPAMAEQAPAEPAVDPLPHAAPVVEASAFVGRRFVSIPEQRFNLEDTTRIAELMEVPREARDGAWVMSFQDAAWNASTVLPAQPVFLGPDGMPYVRLELPPVGEPAETNCLSNIFASAAEQGFGVAYFKNATDTPDLAEYVMPTGVVESLRAYGTYDGDPTDAQEMAARPAQEPTSGVQETMVEKERQVMVGTPAEAYLPRHTARLLYRHLTEGWKIEEPRVALIVDPEMTPSRNLVIGRKFSEFPDHEVASRATQMLLWYFPPRRYLLLMPENWTLEQMVPLKDLC
ncbi:MAG: hypothetical protein ACR2JE_11845 [Acidobacteriaceae bacterium]